MQLVRFPALAFDRAVQEIAAVKLDSRLIGRDFQHAPAAWIVEFGGFRQFPALAVQHPVMVIAMTPVQLFIVRVNPRSNGGRFAKIKGRRFHRLQLTRRNQPGIHGREARCMDCELMVQNVALASQIEIGVISQIDDGVFVCRCRILDSQTPFHQCVTNHRRQVTWISCLAVFTQITQLHSVRDRLRFPDHVVEAVRAAVQSVFAVVQRQRVFLAIQGKAAVRDAIPITANDGPEERRGRAVKVGHIAVEVIEAKHHVRRPAVAVWSLQGNHNPAVGCDSSFVITVAQSVDLHRSSVRQFSKWFARHFRLRLRDHCNR